jgi:hypothetical protein
VSLTPIHHGRFSSLSCRLLHTTTTKVNLLV